MPVASPKVRFSRPGESCVTYPTGERCESGIGGSGEKTSRMKAVSDTEFPSKVLRSSRPIAVLFSTPTCPTCRVFKRELNEVVEKLEGKAGIYEMDVTSTNTWREYDVLTLPTIIVFREGEITGRFTSLPKENEVEKALRT